MLKNRILVVSFTNRILDLLSQVKTDYIFIHLEHPSKYKSTLHSFEALIFESQLFLDLGEIIKDYKNKPIFGLGTGPTLDGIHWIKTIPKPEALEEILALTLGDLRAPPIDTGKIELGSIVKNKTFGSWGKGIVKEELGEDLFLVHFPNAFKIVKKKDHTCHKSTLRLICSVKELTSETDK